MSKNLVFQTAFIGDVLLSIPLLKAIKHYYPDQELHLFCRKELFEFMSSCPFIDKVIVANKSSNKEWAKSVNALKDHSYNMVFCPHQSFRSALTVHSLDAKIKIGFSSWWNFAFFNHRIQRPMDLPDALRQLSLLTAVSGPFRKLFNKLIISQRPLNLSTLENTKSFILDGPDFLNMKLTSVKNTNKDSNLRIGLAPGSVWNTKRWDKYTELAKKLTDESHHVVLLGSKAELPICNKIQEACGSLVSNECGKGTLLDAYNMIKGLDLIVTNDSGLMHLACCADVSIVSIFGPTTPALGYQPWSEKAFIVQKELPCRPCGKHGHSKCPIGTHECMKGIKVEVVSQAIKKTLIT